MKMVNKIFLRIKSACVIILCATPLVSLSQKPIIQTKFTADPAPMVWNDTVFLYTSHDEDYAPEGMAGFRMKEWLLYTSTDMVNWTDHGVVASLHDFDWVRDKENGAWAPHCIERNGKFYLYCPMPGGIGMGVLVADTPYGPFKDPIGGPLVCNSHEDIDPAVFIDHDGQAYLYWGNPNLWYARLNEDMVTIEGEITKDALVRKTEGSPDQYHYQEGPWVYERDGNYYLAYASTCCPEGIGYSMGPGPTGPWEFKGYIMRPDGRSSGNHPGIIDYRGKTYLFGFNYLLNFAITDVHHERRSVCVAEMTFEPDGTIRELPWWDDGVAVEQIHTLDPYRRTEAQTMAWSEGLTTGVREETGLYVTSIHNGDYLMLKGVDFGKGAKKFQASATPLSGGTIKIRLDGKDGPLVGTCEVSGNGSGDVGEWELFSTRVRNAEGVHDLYFVFTGGEGELFDFDHWMFLN